MTAAKPRQYQGCSLVAARKTVFVVDDDLGTLEGFERLLKVYGFDVEVFGSVEEFRQRATPYDAICLVLDVHLNDVSGIDLRRELALAGISTPVIFVSADDSEITQKAAFDSGCVDYLVKPVPAKLLMDAIERASAQQPGSRKNEK